MMKLPKILLIYTGGTIGMIKDYVTNALKAFNFDELLKYIPELTQLECEISTTSFENPIDSSDMNPGYWLKIAVSIEESYDSYDGFVVLHGSDTMSYSASALSFMMENLSKPIIFTGSQLPIGDLRTDAKENLITSIQIASTWFDNKPLIQEVSLYFEYKLYRGNRTTKISATHFQAFDSPNYPPLVESGVNLNINRPFLFKGNSSKKPFAVNKHMNPNVLVLKLFPGMKNETLDSILKIEGLKVLILETYGAGNAPADKRFISSLKLAIKNNLQIVNVTQCAKGQVAMGLYETSRHLKQIEVVDGKDITTESAVTKAMYLIGNKISGKDFKRKFETSLRGEMN